MDATAAAVKWRLMISSLDSSRGMRVLATCSNAASSSRLDSDYTPGGQRRAASPPSSHSTYSASIVPRFRPARERAANAPAPGLGTNHKLVPKPTPVERLMGGEGAFGTRVAVSARGAV